jgi:hypothetical protein
MKIRRFIPLLFLLLSFCCSGCLMLVRTAVKRAKPTAASNPVVAALDANRDGEIDAAELAGASGALRALDRNGDGRLARDEIESAR